MGSFTAQSAHAVFSGPHAAPAADTLRDRFETPDAAQPRQPAAAARAAAAASGGGPGAARPTDEVSVRLSDTGV